jgi:hypothetical protein
VLINGSLGRSPGHELILVPCYSRRLCIKSLRRRLRSW